MPVKFPVGLKRGSLSLNVIPVLLPQYVMNTVHEAVEDVLDSAQLRKRFVEQQ